MVFMGKQLASEEIRGKTVAIIGGGPSGCATAIRLVHLSRKQDLGLRVVLFEGKDFERHYNQCAGVFARFFRASAKRGGGEVSKSRVTAIDFPNKRRDKVFLYTEGGMIKADAVVAAYGFDDGMMSVFEMSTGGRYRRPGKYMHTFVVKIATDRTFIEKKLGSIIYA